MDMKKLRQEKKIEEKKVQRLLTKRDTFVRQNCQKRRSNFVRQVTFQNLKHKNSISPMKLIGIKKQKHNSLGISHFV